MLSFDELSSTGPGGLTLGTTLLSTAGDSTSGVTLDHATAATLKVRTRANSADAALQAGNVTVSGTLTYGGTALSSVVTGTGAMVLATNPTISSLVVTGTLTYGGVALASSVTGTGSMVLSVAPAITGAATFVSLSATGNVVANSGTAISSVTATTQNFITGSSTADFGLYFGSGTPSFTAATGSLYLNAAGSSTSTRAFVRSSASTWIAVTTAS